MGENWGQTKRLPVFEANGVGERPCPRFFLKRPYTHFKSSTSSDIQFWPFMAEYSFRDRDVDSEADHSNSRPDALSLDEFGIPGKALCESARESDHNKVHGRIQDN